MVNDGAVGIDRLEVTFDDERLVTDAGVVLVATLAGRLGLEALARRCVRLRPGRGQANAGRKVMTLIYAICLGADSIDDTNVLRAGRTGRLLGGWMPAPSTLGTFLRAFTFGPCGNSTSCSASRSSAPGNSAPAPATTAW